MERENSLGQLKLFTKGRGVTTRRMAVEKCNTKMVAFMKAVGKMTSVMVKEK